MAAILTGVSIDQERAVTNDLRVIGNICARFIAPLFFILTGVLVYYGNDVKTYKGLLAVIFSASLVACLCAFLLPLGLDSINRWAVRQWRRQWVEMHIPEFCRTLVQNENGLAVLRQTHPSTVGGRIAHSMVLKFCSIIADSYGRSLYEVNEMCGAYERTIADELYRQVAFLRNRTLPENRRDFFQQMNLHTEWLDPSKISAIAAPKTLYFRDPIYGSVRLDQNLSTFVLHPIVQRLNEIRQLGFAFASSPSATHTRLAHSLGVSYLAGQVMQRVLREGILYTRSGKKNIDQNLDKKKLIFKASLCGLIHDVSHSAFGHTVDRLLAGHIAHHGKSRRSEIKPVDKRMFGHLIETHLKHLIEPHFSIEEIIRIVTGQTAFMEADVDPWDYFISMLINSDADVDRIDYLQRDALFTAEPSGVLNVPALIGAIRPWEADDNRIYMTYAEDFVSLVEDFVLARDLMYLRCYDSPSKLVGEWLALRSINMVLERIPNITDHLDSFTLLTDAQLPELLASAQDLGDTGQILRNALCSGALAYEEVASVPILKDAVTGILAPVYHYWLGNDPELVMAVRAAEKKLSEDIGCSWHEVLIALPAPNALEQRDANIFLLRRDDETNYSIVPLTGQGRGDEPGAAAEYPSPLMKPMLVTDESTGENRRVTLSSFAVMERARIRLFAKDTLSDNKINELRQAFAKICPRCRLTPDRLHD